MAQGYDIAVVGGGPGGYDNAHLPENIRGLRTECGLRLRAKDHKHFREQEAQTYVFISPEKLLEDFWQDVYRILREEGIE